MDLWCTIGCDDCGQKKIILPNEVELQSLEIQSTKDQKKDETDSKETIKENTDRMLDPVFNISKFAELVHQSIEKIEKSNDFWIGDTDQKRCIGSALKVINRNTFAEITDNELIFCDQNPIGSDGRYIEKRFNKIGITPANNDNDSLILVLQNGCVILRTGGFLFFDLPIVVVQSNGEYWTISGGSRNILRLKSGSHLAILAKLGIPVPIIFIRRPEKLLKVVEAKDNSSQKKSNNSKEESQELKANESTLYFSL